MDKEQKKIQLPEAIIMVMIAGGADALEAVTGMLVVVPIIGKILLFANFLVDISVFAIVQFWLIMKGGIGFKKQMTALVGNLIEFVPGLDILPFRTTALIITIYLVNHPKVAQIAASRTTAGSLIKGKAGTAGKTEASSTTEVSQAAEAK